jgi:DNA-binding ferritin-like protein
MATTLKLQTSGGYGEQNTMNDIHRLFMLVKISHYATTSFAAHSAFDRTFETLEDLIDEIAEKVIGYTGIPVTQLVIGTVTASSPMEVGGEIIKVAKKIEDFATKKGYPDLQNVAQSLSGAGAQLQYLARLS